MRELRSLDYGHPAPPPREVVEGFCRYGRLTLVTGREGSAKSLLMLGLARAVAHGEPFLGLRTHAGRVLYVDEENHPEDALERLYGLGLRARDHDRVRVICQQSLDLTAVPDLEALTHEVEMFRPALVIIDGALSAAPSLDPSDNGQVTRLLKALRRTAQDADCGLVLLAHVPKHSRDDDDDAVLGANAWRTQVDAAFRSVRRGGSGHYTRQSLDAGHVDETYRYELRSSSKVRWGAGHGRACPFRTRSERNEDGALLWLRVEQDGDVRAKSSNREPSPTKREQVRQQVAALIAERRRITTAELVAALPDVAERTLKRVLAEDGEGLWTRPTEGVYEATEERA